MKKVPKVLLASLINIIKGYCLYDWLDMVSRLTYPNLDIFLVDNSHNKKFHKGLRNLGFDVGYVDPRGKETRQYMMEGNELQRKRAIEGGYDYLFILECDIFPPTFIIEKLISQNKHVIGTTYWTGHGKDMTMQLLTLDKKSESEYIGRYLSLEESLTFMDGTTKPTFASGNGCILIHRSVFEKVKFRINEKEPGFADKFFDIDIFKMKIPNFVDTSILPEHRNMDWNIVENDIGHRLLEIDYLKNLK